MHFFFDTFAQYQSAILALGTVGGLGLILIVASDFGRRDIVRVRVRNLGNKLFWCGMVCALGVYAGIKPPMPRVTADEGLAVKAWYTCETNIVTTVVTNITDGVTALRDRIRAATGDSAAEIVEWVETTSNGDYIDSGIVVSPSNIGTFKAIIEQRYTNYNKGGYTGVSVSGCILWAGFSYYHKYYYSCGNIEMSMNIQFQEGAHTVFDIDAEAGYYEARGIFKKEGLTFSSTTSKTFRLLGIEVSNNSSSFNSINRTYSAFVSCGGVSVNCIPVLLGSGEYIMFDLESDSAKHNAGTGDILGGATVTNVAQLTETQMSLWDVCDVTNITTEVVTNIVALDEINLAWTFALPVVATDELFVEKREIGLTNSADWAEIYHGTAADSPISLAINNATNYEYCVYTKFTQPDVVATNGVYHLNAVAPSPGVAIPLQSAVIGIDGEGATTNITEASITPRKKEDNE